MAHPRNTLSDQCPRVELGRKSYTEPAIEEVYNDRQKGCPDCLSSAGSAMPKQTLKTSSTDIRLARAGGDEDDPQLFR